MNRQTEMYVENLKKQFPEYFKKKKVLEIGSANINGSVKRYFTNCDYVGVDVKPHYDVDIVSIAHRLKAEPNSFDVVFSTNSLEHDMYWKKTLKKMYELLKPNGLLFFIVPSLWLEHGTINNKPEDSLTTQMGDKWANYYYNLSPEDITKIWELNKRFFRWNMSLESHMDLVFWGIK